MKTENPNATTEAPQPLRRTSRRRQIVLLTAGAIADWLLAAYLIIPVVWKEYDGRHPAFDESPPITRTGDRHPGDIKAKV